MEIELPSNSLTHRLYLGAYGFCRDQEGRILLARLSKGTDAGAWTLPGGGVLWGENPEQTVLREMEEETGLVDLALRSVAAIYSHTYHQTAENPLSPLHHIGIIYHLEVDPHDLKFEKGGTTDFCQWLAKEEALALPLTPLGRFGVDLAWPEAKL